VTAEPNTTRSFFIEKRGLQTAALFSSGRIFQPFGARIELHGRMPQIGTTKNMDWFSPDFVDTDGSKAAAVRKYVPSDKQRMIDGASKFDIDYAEYHWALNDWKR
jgi:hypothetical protein